MHKCVVLLVLLAACGDDGGVHHLPDAPAAPDAPNPDAPTSGVVDLTVVSFGEPMAGLDVYFQAANGSLVAKVATNAQGVASATMEAGGYVTVANPFPRKGGPDDVRTFGGVKPGDHLKLHEESGASMFITFVGPALANAVTYELYSSCGQMQFVSPGGGSGSSPNPSTTMFFGTCGATADFAILARDNDNIAIGGMFKAGVPVSDGATIDLTAETYDASATVTQAIAWTGVPAAYTQIDSTSVIASASGPMITTYTGVPLKAGVGSTTFERPSIPSPRAVTTSRPQPSNGFGDLYVVEWGAAPAAIAVDLSSSLLGAYTGTPSVSPATRTVTWATDAGATPDFAWAQLRGARDSATVVNWTWSISVPFSATTFTLPLLPAGIDQYNPMATDSMQVDELITAKVPGGYDAVRAELLSTYSPATFVAGTAGRISYETIYQQPR